MRSCRNAEPGIMSNRLWQEQFLMLTGITGVWGNGRVNQRTGVMI